MKKIQVFFITFLFLTSKLSALLDQYDFFFEKIYEEFTPPKIEYLNDMEFCPSILEPTADTLAKSVEASFRNAEQNTNATEQEILDSCCRTLYMCGAQKKIDLNGTKNSNTRNCECENGFRECLENINGKTSSRFAFAYSIQRSACLAESYPIVKCVKFQIFFAPTAIFYRSPNAIEQKSDYIRCLEYEFDKNKPKIYQTFDLTFIYKIGKYDFIKDAEEATTNYFIEHPILSKCIKNSTETCHQEHAARQTIIQGFSHLFSLIYSANTK
ncbi:uncharacterized protein LOC116347983 [Contarinia nasturtii]|uniref:uncharacterized protein LOC116347983 n=1 Tax=Contarinia nasturtii TaxID=265458 RepID=UPI0012D4B365|nr:uncharacterized protein LOC116347983 [Contarinia nasturtii]